MPLEDHYRRKMIERETNQTPVCYRHPDRERAIHEGRKLFVLTNSAGPCPKCGGVIMFVNSFGCHFCMKTTAYKNETCGCYGKREDD